MDWVKKIAIALFAILAVIPLIAWFVLSSSVLGSMRADLASRYLSGVLNHPVQIHGDVAVRLGPVVQVSARGIVLPSHTVTDVNLAEIGSIQFGLGLSDLVRSEIKLQDTVVDAPRLRLVADEKGHSSWTPAAPGAGLDAERAEPVTTHSPERASDIWLNTLPSVLATQVTVTDFDLLYQDARNGLDLDLRFPTLNLGPSDQPTRAQITAEGTLNDQALTMRGTVLDAGQLDLTVAFAEMSAHVDLRPDPKDAPLGYSGTVTAEIAQTRQVFEVLKLKNPVSGSGAISAAFRAEQGQHYVDDLNIDLALDTGPSLKLAADLGQITEPADDTVEANILFYAPDDLPAPTKAWRDLKSIGVDMRLTARSGDVPLREMVIATNGFLLVTGGEGPPPISISGIRRTPDGLVRIEQAVVRIGQPDAPYLVFEGSIADAVMLGGLDVTAALQFPVGAMFAPELLKKTQALGQLSGGFKLVGDSKDVAVTDVEIFVKDTELWRLNATGRIGNLFNARDAEMDVSADVPSAAELLEALGIPPRNPGVFGAVATVSGQGQDWEADVELSVGDSNLVYIAEFDLNRENPVIGRRIESDLIKITDLRSILSAVMQIRDFNTRTPGKDRDAQSRAGAPKHALVVQPLVLEDVAPVELSRSGPTNATASETVRQVQPLVLETSSSLDTAPSDPFLGDTPETRRVVQPLVIRASGFDTRDHSKSEGPIAANVQPDGGTFQNVTLRPLGQAILQSDLELGIAVDLRKIVGLQGVTSLQTHLEIMDQMARMGPIRFAYGGGRFDVTGLMNLTASSIRVFGNASGWDLAKILREVGFQKHASGVLTTEFDVSGVTGSVREFLATLSGRATVSMTNGSIETDLIDLAGLGVIPWLFSTDHNKITPIACARLPLTISKGIIATQFATVETDRVQVVIDGNVDVRANTLNVVGQPRRIGKPNSRSPWPFQVSGSLSDPQVAVKSGKRPPSRVTTMPEQRQPCVADILQVE